MDRYKKNLTQNLSGSKPEGCQVKEGYEEQENLWETIRAFFAKFVKDNKRNDDYLYELEISDTIGEEYIPMIEDVSRMITLQIIIQFMLHLRDSEQYPFFSEGFFELLFYIILGLVFYWMVMRKFMRPV